MFRKIINFLFVIKNFIYNIIYDGIYSKLLSGDDLYHTNCNPYHTYKNGFITHGVYHIDFQNE